jgi:hypothetical protein
MNSELITDIGYGWFWLREDGITSAHYGSRQEAEDAFDRDLIAWDEEST